MISDFKILGVEESASPAEVKIAYRNKAKEFHPDVSGDKDQLMHHMAMIRLNRAYENILKDLSSPKTRNKSQDLAYEHYKKGKELYKEAVEANWFPSSINNSDEFNRSVLRLLIREFSKAYYEFSIVKSEYPQSPWIEDTKRIMQIIEKMVPRYKKLLKMNIPF